jgi:bacterioferritin (cytochrome b1)
LKGDKVDWGNIAYAVISLVISLMGIALSYGANSQKIFDMKEYQAELKKDISTCREEMKDYVTHQFFRAVMDPLKEDIAEIKKMIRTIMNATES